MKSGNPFPSYTCPKLVSKAPSCVTQALVTLLFLCWSFRGSFRFLIARWFSRSEGLLIFKAPRDALLAFKARCYGGSSTRYWPPGLGVPSVGLDPLAPPHLWHPSHSRAALLWGEGRLFPTSSLPLLLCFMCPSIYCL